MKNTIPLLIFAFLLTGCVGLTPRQQFIRSEIVYTSTNAGLLKAYDRGWLNARQYDSIQEANAVIGPVLTEWGLSQLTDDASLPDDTDRALAQIEALDRILQTILTKPPE